MRNVVINLLFVGVALGVAGCASTSDRGTPGEEYRTVQTEPRRETEEAKRANRAGLEHLAEGDLEGAEKAFKRALTFDVEYGPAHNNLGKVYYRQEKWYKAAWEFEYASKLMPRHAAPHNNLGLVLEQAGELDRAVEQYDKAVGLDESNPEYIGNLARAMLRRGDRTGELQTLLEKLLDRDTRPEWVQWAKRQKALLERSTD